MKLAKLTLEERFEWLKTNNPNNLDWNWEQVSENIKDDMYSYIFNHPYYCGTNLTDDEARHKLLDDLNVPRVDFKY